MSMVSTLLGFIGFKLLDSRAPLTAPLSPAETFCFSAYRPLWAGCKRVTAGFVGIIPALEHLITADGGWPLRSLMLWSAGLCFFGLLFAVLFHEHIII